MDSVRLRKQINADIEVTAFQAFSRLYRRVHKVHETVHYLLVIRFTETRLRARE